MGQRFKPDGRVDVVADQRLRRLEIIVEQAVGSLLHQRPAECGVTVGASLDRFLEVAG